MKRSIWLALPLALMLAAGLESAPAEEGKEDAKPAAPVGKELNLFAWSEYVPQAVIDGFTKETGIQVNYETYASNEEMLAKLMSGAQKYDLIQPSEYTIEALAKEGQLREIDWSKVPNFKNIDNEYKNLPDDPKQKYSVPWMAGSVGIVVNTAKVKDPVKGYGDVFQKKYENRIVILDDPREIVSWALETKGRTRPPLVTWSEYGGDRFVAAVENGPLVATQFHPEKSGDAGLQILRNFLQVCGPPSPKATAGHDVN